MLGYYLYLQGDNLGLSDGSNMPNEQYSEPHLYRGVMVSSTFTDLEQHRSALIKAIKGQGLTDVAMENDSAKPDLDVIDSSLEMVKDASAYIGVISRKYGQTPACPKRNPGKLSITELEFNEAMRLDRPILLFIMSDKHKGMEADFESSGTKKKKLKAFRERAKQMKANSPVHRVYATFDSLEEFKEKAGQSVASLRRYLDATPAPKAQTQSHVPVMSEVDPIPSPPALYAEPPYIGSHKFVGRSAQLDVLNDWASPADAHPILLFDAIGGSGKSMLTWEWMTQHAIQTRSDWAGRFWYSFYERGAIMADFCRRALAYITGSPLDGFRKMKTPELGEKLLRHLQNRPWLFVLDGLERVLVAYHRFDAAEISDEEATQPTDQIARRDPRTAIRPEDDDLLRKLASASPSKLLISSRLVPAVLLNQAVQTIPGVLRVPLPGLRPADAESLLRSCGITGNSQVIQDYLKSHCDCHPLVTGALAGPINDYLPNKGNFDAWAADPAAGGQLDIADLDLVAKRNHILKSAIEGAPPKGRQLLSTMALLSEAIDYPTLSALNPHLPPEPENVEVPTEPEIRPNWKGMPKSQRRDALKDYRSALQRQKAYEEAIEARLRSPEFLAAPGELTNTVRDLERRGLLQYDGFTRRYDLHPVVRAIAARGLRPEEKDRYGERVVDYFSTRTHDPYEEAETLDDVSDGLRIVRFLLRMGRYKEAADVYCGELGVALLVNLEAYAESLSLTRPFFPRGWAILPGDVDDRSARYLAFSAAFALEEVEELTESLRAYGAGLAAGLQAKDWEALRAALQGISVVLRNQNKLATENRCTSLHCDLANLSGNLTDLFTSRLSRFSQLSLTGRWADAQALWNLLDPMGRDWPRPVYRPGSAEFRHARFQFWQGNLTEDQLAHGEQLAKAAKNRGTLRDIYQLRGEWLIERAEWSLAAESLQEAVSMARAIGQLQTDAETLLAFCRLKLGYLSNPRHDIEQLADVKHPSHPILANMWLITGDRKQATLHAQEAYKWAWADGEPYVRRYDLNKVQALLTELGAEPPKLLPYGPSKKEKFPFEDELVSFIERVREEQQAE